MPLEDLHKSGSIQREECIHPAAHPLAPMSRSPELEILGVEDKVSCLDKSLKDLDLLPELESGNPGLTSSKETAREEAEEGPIQLLSDRQLIIFGLAQLVVFAAAVSLPLVLHMIIHRMLILRVPSVCDHPSDVIHPARHRQRVQQIR